MVLTFWGELRSYNNIIQFYGTFSGLGIKCNHKIIQACQTVMDRFGMKKNPKKLGDMVENPLFWGHFEWCEKTGSSFPRRKKQRIYNRNLQ